MGYASEKEENEKKGEWEVKHKTKNKIDEDPVITKLVTEELKKVDTKAEENLKPQDECMVCFDHFAVSFQFSCCHELCALCAVKNMCVCNQKCPMCRAVLPNSLSTWLSMIHIYPIQLTPNYPLERLQYEFPLICVVANLTTVAKCISMGVDVNTEGINTFFPVHLASETSVVKYLVEHGADAHQVNVDGETPLSMSSENGHLQVVQYLIEHGADVNRGDNNGVTPLWMSSQGGYLPVVQCLIEHGADVNQVNVNGGTPIFMSSQAGHLPVVQYLIQHGADVNQGNNYGVTPLLVSSGKGHLPVVQYLIEHGADVNKGNNDGITPLAVAIYTNQTEVAKFLLRKNADIESAKFIFKECGDLKLIEILENLCKEIKQ